MTPDIHAIGERWTAPGGPSLRALANELGVSRSALRNRLYRAGYMLDDVERLTRASLYGHAGHDPAAVAERAARGAVDPEANRAREHDLARADEAWRRAFQGSRYGAVRVSRDSTRLHLPETHVHTQSSAA